MQKELIILDEDRGYAIRRIAELEKTIQELGPEFYDVFNQSSETWHDNAPFDALRDRQSVLDAELQHLRKILKNARLTECTRAKKNTISIGSKVTLSDGKRYLIAGDWTARAGQMHDGWMVVSSGTPLAASLLGKRVGETIAMGQLTTTITAITPQ